MDKNIEVSCNVKEREDGLSLMECSVKKDSREIGRVGYKIDLEGNSFGFKIDGDELLDLLKQNPNLLNN